MNSLVVGVVCSSPSGLTADFPSPKKLEITEMTEAYIKFMPKPYPVRTCVGVAKLPRGTDVEIECTAGQ